MDNRLVLAGHLTRAVRRRTTPAGIPISRLTLAHESQQSVADMRRQAVCRIEVVVAGQALNQVIASVEPGQQLRVTGFLARSQQRDEETRLVLHAQEIELIASS